MGFKQKCYNYDKLEMFISPRTSIAFADNGIYEYGPVKHDIKRKPGYAPYKTSTGWDAEYVLAYRQPTIKSSSYSTIVSDLKRDDSLYEGTIISIIINTSRNDTLFIDGQLRIKYRNYWHHSDTSIFNLIISNCPKDLYDNWVFMYF